MKRLQRLARIRARVRDKMAGKLAVAVAVRSEAQRHREDAAQTVATARSGLLTAGELETLSWVLEHADHQLAVAVADAGQAQLELRAAAEAASRADQLAANAKQEFERAAQIRDQRELDDRAARGQS